MLHSVVPFLLLLGKYHLQKIIKDWVSGCCASVHHTGTVGLITAPSTNEYHYSEPGQGGVLDKDVGSHRLAYPLADITQPIVERPVQLFKSTFHTREPKSSHVS